MTIETRRAVVGDRRALIPDVVVAELKVGAERDARLQAALDASWVLRQELSSPEELAAFADFASKLVVGDRNLGECGVLALGATIECATVVLDDGAARRAAKDARVPVRPTLALLCDSVRAGLLTLDLVSALADDLIAGSYRLPFPSGGFKAWALENDMGTRPAAL